MIRSPLVGSSTASLIWKGGGAERWGAPSFEKNDLARDDRGQRLGIRAKLISMLTMGRM